jgi:hypothetical protein
MQPLVVQIATTFLSDATALVNGFGRIVTHILMAPVERIANACDVAGVLQERSVRAAEREQIKRAWRVLGRDTPRRYRSRRSGRLFGCLHFLGELT